MKIPLTDAVIVVISNMVDDTRGETRKPSHYDIGVEIERAGLSNADPKKQGMTVGKAKRIRSVLNWAIDNDYEKGEKLVKQIIELVRANGGFKTDSPNYVGESVVGNCKDVLKSLGIILGPDGIVTPMLFDTLPMVEQEKALKVYVERAKRGVEDAALLVGTGKDLLEAVSAYVLQEKWGSIPSFMSFPTLLGQAFSSISNKLGLDKGFEMIGEAVLDILPNKVRKLCVQEKYFCVDNCSPKK